MGSIPPVNEPAPPGRPMTLRRGHLWAIAGVAVAVVAAIVISIVAVNASGGSDAGGGSGGTGTHHAPTGPFGHLLFTRIGFATNCAYVATVSLQPGGPALA